MKQSCCKQKSRRCAGPQAQRSRGASIAEFPVTMMLIFLFLLFPAIDLLSLAVAYMAGSTLNDMQLREAALVPFKLAQAPNGAVRKGIPNAWRDSGLGRYVKVEGEITTTMTYTNGITDENGLTERIVRVKTDFSASPFLTIPFPLSVPGLNAPCALTFSNERSMEDPTDAP